MEDSGKKGCFSLLSTRFPDVDLQIATWYEQNDNFHEMCDQYSECCQAISFWKEMEFGEAKDILEEYLNLQRDLEQEIHEFLHYQKKACLGEPSSGD